VDLWRRSPARAASCLEPFWIEQEDAGQENERAWVSIFGGLLGRWWELCMPIIVGAPTRRLERDEFGRIAYDVMRCVFDIHNEFGRFFDERIYKRELARRFPGTSLEIPIHVSFESFEKQLFLDALVQGGAVFEFKTVEVLTSKHRSQLLQYLLLADLPRGKLVNVRSDLVEHRFVNTTLRRADRVAFTAVDWGWQDIGGPTLRECVVALLRDWGASLTLNLYEEALTHLLGGDAVVVEDVDVVADGVVLAKQKFHMAAPGVAFRLTCLSDRPGRFETHARRLLDHTPLSAIQWVNITRREVAFKTIQR
jgi:GxxExxY protein